MATPTPLEQKTEAAVQRVVRFVNAFPKPSATGMVSTTAARAALAPLRPMAVKIASLSVGTKKGSIAAPGIVTALLRQSVLYLVAEAYEGGPAAPGTGYLSGSPIITEADRTTAQFMLALLDKILPEYPAPVLDPVLYTTIKQQAHKLLLIATDLDIDTSVADQAALLWAALKETVKEYAAAITSGAKAGLGLLEIALIAAGVGAGIYIVKSVAGK
jgi:hypothetical protein